MQNKPIAPQKTVVKTIIFNRIDNDICCYVSSGGN